MSRVVIKLGGSCLGDAGLRASLLGQIADLHRRGIDLVLVHGGGKQIAAHLGRLGIESRFHEGLRITDEETRDIAQMILAGKVGKDLAAEFGGLGVRAASLAGGDGDFVLASRMPAADGVDLGYVGKVVAVNSELIDALTSAGIVPVVACLGLGADDRAYYNINGDQMASAIAGALKADDLILVTDVGGVLDGDGRLIPRLDRRRIEELIESGVASGGMRPKLRACLEALASGVARIRIVGAQEEQVLLRALEGEAAPGTTIVN